MIEELVLGILSEKDMTGYAIKTVIEKSFSTFCKISYGSLYPALKRLGDKGQISTCEVMQGGRKSIVYHLAENGKAALYEWLTSPMDIIGSTNENLARIYFFDRLSPDARKTQVENFLLRNEEYLSSLCKLRDKLEANDCFEEYYYKLSTLYYGICVTRQVIEWARHIRDEKPLTLLLKEEKL